MLKTEPARQKGKKWAKVPLREWKMKCIPGLLGLSTPILLLSLFTGLSGKPLFSQNASIAHQRLFWLGTAFCMRNLPFFVRAGLKALANGGNNDLLNIQVLCMACHGDKTKQAKANGYVNIVPTESSFNSVVKNIFNSKLCSDHAFIERLNE
jgi:hypothetical protein